MPPHFYGLTILLLIISLEGCVGGPNPSSPQLPPSASDLDLLGLTRLCDKTEMIRSRGGKKTYRRSPWGSGKEWYSETNSPRQKKQWLFFNEDDTLVALVSSYPSGLDLGPYPVLRDTLSQLTPAREFFTNSDSLISGTRPDTIRLYRTGDEKTTTQYLVRQNDDDDQDLLVAVIVLDPYETLLDGAQPKFLSPTATSQSKPHAQRFLASQQFARGEISLFESCPGKKPDIAIDAYHQGHQARSR